MQDTVNSTSSRCDNQLALREFGVVKSAQHEAKPSDSLPWRKRGRGLGLGCALECELPSARVLENLTTGIKQQGKVISAGKSVVLCGSGKTFKRNSSPVS
jgi:hypothetical protein